MEQQSIFCLVENLLQSTLLHITNKAGGKKITAETYHGVFFPQGFLIKVSLCLQFLFTDPPFRTCNMIYKSGAGLPSLPTYPW